MYPGGYLQTPCEGYASSVGLFSCTSALSLKEALLGYVISYF